MDARLSGGWAGHLQVGDDAVLYILFLLAQEVEAHGVERVGAELVLPQQNLGWAKGRWALGIQKVAPEDSTLPTSPAYLQHVHLHPAHHADHLAVPPARLLRLEGRVSDGRTEAGHATQEREPLHLGTQHAAAAGGMGGPGLQPQPAPEEQRPDHPQLPL